MVHLTKTKYCKTVDVEKKKHSGENKKENKRTKILIYHHWQ